MSVPRGTLTHRISVRVGEELKTALQRAVRDLRSRGLRTTESEIVELAVDEAVHASRADLEQRLIRWRQQQEQEVED